MARGWKRWVEKGLADLGIAALRLRWARPSAVILAYHNVVPHGESSVGERSLQTDQAAFADQLDVLCDSHDVVPLDQVLEGSPDARPRAALTFDDAYLGCLTAGAEEMQKRGLPYTVMVAPGILGGPCWWDQLAGADGIVDSRVRDHALWTLEGRGEAVLAWAREEGVPVREGLPDWARPADAGSLLAWAGSPGASMGAHTWSHANLCALRPEEALDELRRCADWMREVSPPDPWFAYPYGIHDAAVAGVTAQLYTKALLVSGGPIRHRGVVAAPPMALPRVNVPRGLTTQGLKLRLAGLVS